MQMIKEKECTKCKTKKDLSFFSKDSSRTDGLCKWCKSCVNLNFSKYKTENLTKVKEQSKKYYEKNKEKIKEKNKEKYLKNKEKILQKNIEWREKNKAYRKKYMSDYAKQNKHFFAERNMLRYTTLRNRVPKWIGKSELSRIKQIYLEAKEKTEKLGIKHHVDHIIPLHGKTVSGLHVPENLQVLDCIQNLRKKNKYDEWGNSAE